MRKIKGKKEGKTIMRKIKGQKALLNLFFTKFM